MRSSFEVADVLRTVSKRSDFEGLNPWQKRTLSALMKCRTAALGGHIDACDACGIIRISYNSCRNRHCPKCQGNRRQEWILAREQELLPVPYFHVVFTLPEALNPLAIHEPAVIYDLLFEAAWETLFTFGKNKGLRMGMIALLHTWGQNLSLHPHLHCIVPGGGVNADGVWKNIRSDGKYLFAVKALSKVFRAKYCEKLKMQVPEQYPRLRKMLWDKDWVVYAKPPFGSPKAVVEYIGRYSHKVAISNRRIIHADEQQVQFSYKDYRDGNTTKVMSLSPEEFSRRFALHILPKRFVKIRHYGFLSSGWKKIKLPALQKKLFAEDEIPKREEKTEGYVCSCCKAGMMQRVLAFDLRGPPMEFLYGLKKEVSYEK